jgi:hypothetical protein
MGAKMSEECVILSQPKLSDKWECLLFGSDKNGFTYTPREGYEPNIFVRFMMRLCFDCKWIRKGRIYG